MDEQERRYPSYPIPCAAAVVIDGGSVLLIQRAREPNRGRWSFPGGAIERGETSRECARREVREETGLDVEILDVVTAVDRMFRDERGGIEYQYVIIDYLARSIGGTLQPGDDAMQAAWIGPDEAMGYDLAPPTGEVLQQAIVLWRKMNSARVRRSERYRP